MLEILLKFHGIKEKLDSGSNIWDKLYPKIFEISGYGGSYFLMPVDFVDLKKRLPKEAGVVQRVIPPQAGPDTGPNF